MGVTAALERCEASQPEINAFISIDQGAATRARRDLTGPLAGVPVALKDIIDQAGHTTTCGSSFYRNQPEASAPVVTRLEEAGAVIVGRTGLHEFAFGFTSENHWFGPVRNPWDRATSPGGSSGGSAAAVAAGCVPVAIGTDTGGSVRVPAALCGVFGLKATHGRVPLRGVFPLVPSLDTVGPLARSVADLAAAYLAIAGHDPDDPWSRPVAVEPPSTFDSMAGIRIGVPHPWADRPVAAEIETAFNNALLAAAADGAEIVHLDAPRLVPDDAMQRAGAAEIAAVHGDWFRAHPERYGPRIRDRLQATLEVPVADVGRVPTWRAGKQAAALSAFEQVDLLATPMTATRRKVIGADTVTVAGADEPYRPALWAFSWLVNHLGCPALAAPMPATNGGPPPSLQLIAPLWAEAALLGIARRLEDLEVVSFTSPPYYLGD